MRRLKKLLSVLGAVVCAVALMISPVYADTDGTEIQVAQPSKLEIQLGGGWTGVQFQLKTDVGVYLEPISVGEDGVLRLEIGGSSTYILSCLNSVASVPENSSGAAEDGIAVETPEAAPVPEQAPPSELNPEKTAIPQEPSAEQPENAESEGRFTGIPTMHIVLFGGGLLLAVGGLIAMRIVSKRHEKQDEYDDGYDEDDY